MSKDRKSILQLHEESKSNLNFDDLPVGTAVRIVAPYQDGYFWYGETGVVEKNTRAYLGVTVLLNEPRRFEERSQVGGKIIVHVQERHGFKPEDLELIREDK